MVPNYGTKVQYAPDADTSQLATKDEKTFIQQVVGTFLYYGRAVDVTMLTALSRFKHLWSGKPEDQPYAHVVPNYGAKVQYAPGYETSRLPERKDEKTFIQQVV